jgi:hypothetical protein
MVQPHVVSGWNPPLPVTSSDATSNSGSSSSSANNNIGQRVLTLVRSLENLKPDQDDNSYSVRFEETVRLLNNLIAISSRRGLLQGNETKAEQVLASQKAATSVNGNSNAKKRGNKKGSASNDLQIHTGDVDSSGNILEASAVQQDEAFVMSALLRILSAPNETSKARKSFGDDEACLIELAADLVVAMSERIKSVTSVDTCTLAEYELLAQAGKPLLRGLANTLQSIELGLVAAGSRIRKNGCLSGVALDDLEHVGPINSCLKATTSLLGLFGTKLSRSTLLLSDLQSLAWRLVTLPNETIQHSAARLLATIPLAGGTDRKTPSDLWNTAVVDVVSSLSTLLGAMAPLNKGRSKVNDSGGVVSKEMETVVNGWINHIREDLSQESTRVTAFDCCIGGLARCFVCLLARDSVQQSTHSSLLGARLDLESIMNLLEAFLSFPLSAEGIYYRTKKRLRNEIIDGGFLNPISVAVEMASRIKLFGHAILDSLISAVGGPVLLPHARRITKLSYAALLTSCSGPLRKVVDPINAIQLDGKKRRWVHTSIPLRTIGIRSVQSVVLAFGSDRSGKSASLQASSRSSRGSSSDGEKAAAMVAGCLVEQISWNGVQDESDDDWGCLQERIQLV